MTTNTNNTTTNPTTTNPTTDNAVMAYIYKTMDLIELENDIDKLKNKKREIRNARNSSNLKLTMAMLDLCNERIKEIESKQRYANFAKAFFAVNS